MSTEATLQIESSSSERTEQLAEKLGANLRGGETIELLSDLGGGKTTFTRGLVRGAGSTDRVASPTFTINRVYTAPKFTIYHFDFYRLSEAGIVADELAETVHDDKAVTVVEWADIVQDVLPSTRLSIRLELTGETSRRVSFVCPEPLLYLLEGIAE